MRLNQAPCQLVQRVQRLFFLNEAHTLSNFLAADLGVAKYPPYKVHRSRSVFADRQTLLEYEAALQDAATLDDALQVRRSTQTLIAWLWSVQDDTQ
jgi:hypothetical protein